MANGRYQGEPITRIPVGYLRWMVNAGHSAARQAAMELARRGSVLPEIEISGHAIDRASQHSLAAWRHGRDGEEGLHAWMQRAGLEAYHRLDASKDTIEHAGVRWIFKRGKFYPEIKTVTRPRQRRNASPSKKTKPRDSEEDADG